MKLSNIILGFMVLMQLNSTFICADGRLKSLVIGSGLGMGVVATGMLGSYALKCMENYVNRTCFEDSLKSLTTDSGVTPTTEGTYRAHQSGECTGSQESDIGIEQRKFEQSAGEVLVAAKFNRYLGLGQTYQDLQKNEFFSIPNWDSVGELCRVLRNENDRKLEHDKQYERIKGRLDTLTDDELCEKIKELDKLLVRRYQTLNKSRMLVLVAEAGAGKKKTMQALLKLFENHIMEMRGLDASAAIHCLQVYVESINRALVRGNAEHAQILLESARKHFNNFDLCAMACKMDSHALVKELLDNGVMDMDCDFSVNFRRFSQSFITARNHPVMLVRCPIEAACAWGSSKVAELLSQRGVDTGATDLFSGYPSASPTGSVNRDKILLGRGVLPISQPLERYLKDDKPIPSQDQERLSYEYLEYLKQNHQNYLDQHCKWLTSVDTALDNAGLEPKDLRNIVLTMVNGLPSLDKEKMARSQSEREVDGSNESQSH